MEQFYLPRDTCFSTLELPAHKQLEFWLDAVCHAFVPLECKRGNRGVFQAELRNQALGTVHFSEIFSDPHRVLRSKQLISQSSNSKYLLCLQLCSQVQITQCGREAILQPGDFTVFNTAVPYTLDFESRFHQLVLHIPNDIFDRYIPNLQDITATTIKGNIGVGSLASQLIINASQRLGELGSVQSQVVNNLLNLLAISLGASTHLESTNNLSAVQNAHLYEIKSFINNNLNNSALSPDMISKALRLSTRYIHKLFSVGKELSISRYILQQRLNRCKTMLADPLYSGYSIERIAFSWGFNSAPHFSKTFKQYVGDTPKAYRSLQLYL